MLELVWNLQGMIPLSKWADCKCFLLFFWNFCHPLKKKKSLDLSVDTTAQWSRWSTQAKRCVSNRDFYAVLFFMPFVIKEWFFSLSEGIYPRPVSHNLAQTWERLKSEELKMFVHSGFSGFVLVLNKFFFFWCLGSLASKISLVVLYFNPQHLDGIKLDQ